jgi:hypothetical protein
MEIADPHGLRVGGSFWPERKEERMNSIQLNIRSYQLATPMFALMCFASKATLFSG